MSIFQPFALKEFSTLFLILLSFDEYSKKNIVDELSVAVFSSDPNVLYDSLSKLLLIVRQRNIQISGDSLIRILHISEEFLGSIVSDLAFQLLSFLIFFPPFSDHLIKNNILSVFLNHLQNCFVIDCLTSFSSTNETNSQLVFNFGFVSNLIDLFSSNHFSVDFNISVSKLLVSLVNFRFANQVHRKQFFLLLDIINKLDFDDKIFMIEIDYFLFFYDEQDFSLDNIREIIDSRQTEQLILPTARIVDLFFKRKPELIEAVIQTDFCVTLSKMFYFETEVAQTAIDIFQLAIEANPPLFFSSPLFDQIINNALQLQFSLKQSFSYFCICQLNEYLDIYYSLIANHSFFVFAFDPFFAEPDLDHVAVVQCLSRMADISLKLSSVSLYKYLNSSEAFNNLWANPFFEVEKLSEQFEVIFAYISFCSEMNSNDS